MNLDAWQTRLSSQFEKLHKTRAFAGENWPVFGLEHGLSLEEIAELKSDIQAYISKQPPSKNHVLPWIVYASELGYSYEGHEYWQTFEQSTPRWDNYGDRYWIQKSFSQFCSQYGGAKPTGKWADNFTIICWPITHAILPIDLQRQLAKILYDLRYRFSKDMLDNPIILGDMIAERSLNTTSRFQKFAQNQLLVGQIAKALLLQGHEGHESLILPMTLDRIKEDLDKVRHARDWLRHASRDARRVHFEGLSRGSHSSPASIILTVEQARQQLEDLAVEPRLIIRPTGDNGWGVLLEIPDMSQLMVRFPQLHSVLAESRCMVAGSSGRWQARGWVLHGTQLIALDKWPSSSEVLLKFEKSIPQLDFLLRTECLLRPGPVWLFKIANDGLAYEVRSLVVRPGQRYIIVDTTSKFDPESWITQIILECEGANGAILDMPDEIPPQLDRFIQALGLQHSKRIEVWPAGLTAARWDGEGSAEWISSEQPCIGIRVDHEVDKISVLLDENDSDIVEAIPSAVGMPMFIKLPNLRIGTHHVCVSTRFSSTNVDEVSGYLKLLIREPVIWEQGTGTKTALTVVVDPISPTLEQLWENCVDIQLMGPKWRKVSCMLSLFNTTDKEPLIQRTLPPLELPVDTSVWRSHFYDNVRMDRNIPNMYDMSHSCRIVFSADELGSFTLNCEREFCPLRWLFRRDRDGYALRLIDDTGSPTKTSVYRCEFNRPDTVLDQESDSFQRGFEHVSDGLYLANSGEHWCSVISPVAKGSRVKLKSFSELGLQPKFTPRGKSSMNVMLILLFIDFWSSARLPGDLLSQIRQQEVIIELINHLFSLIGGKNWGDAERAFRDQREPDGINILLRVVMGRQYNQKLQEQLLRINTQVASMSIEERIHSLSSIYRSCLHMGSYQSELQQVTRNINWLAEFALRLASQPQGVSQWAGPHIHFGLDQLLENPIAVRSARFLVLASEQEETPIAANRLFPNWEWQ